VAPAGADARSQMIDAAERLAVQQGLGAMSLRAVQAASGQRNKSAAQYHFGSREGLIEALVADRMGPINERRLQLLDHLDDHASLRDLVEVLAVPLAEHSLRPEGSTWSRFLVQGYADPELSHVVRSRVEGRPYQEVRRRLAERLDHLPAELRDRRTDQATGLLVAGLAAAEAGHGSGLPADALVSDLVDLCTAVLEAPASATTLALLEGDARSA
jgi:AcrR family transcriptional regulator